MPSPCQLCKLGIVIVNARVINYRLRTSMFKVMYMQNVADSTSDIHRFEMVSKYYYYYYHILIIMYNAAKDNIIHVHS
jgi:hypothetical protein